MSPMKNQKIQNRTGKLNYNLTLTYFIRIDFKHANFNLFFFFFSKRQTLICLNTDDKINIHHAPKERKSKSLNTSDLGITEDVFWGKKKK